MKKETYLITSNFKTPYVRSTGNPRNPTEIKFKMFKKGDLVSGELKQANGRPAFILYNGVCVIPLSVAKAVVTKEILSSGAEGNTTPLGRETTKKVITKENPKIKYMDGILVGALIGLGAVYLANKKSWIKVPNNMNFAYGAGIGSALAAYFIYRKNNKPKPQVA